ncbi:MAG: SDR family NAD(P)-dependent oxidoreductase [Nanoarchaeota archaeon]|nr:SDR family NAD(P)-dependent oxidoreductase [Nanoarchaeota archaeon]
MNKDLFKNKVVLVTGGAGFIGSHLVDKALELGAEKVICYDNLAGTNGSLNNIAHWKTDPRFTFVKADIKDYQEVKPWVEESDIIFNEAASKLVVSLKDPTIDVQTNVVGNFNIAEIMRKSESDARIIHASTGSVFGSSDKPFEEVDAMNPSTVYGISKLAAEKYFLLYHRLYGIKATVLRYFHVFGPRQDYTGEAGVVGIFLSRVLKGLPPQVCGTGEAIRCFTFVDDAVDANLILYKNNRSIGQDYNVASRNRISVLQLANQVISKYGPPGMRPEFIAPRLGENLKPIPSTKKIENVGFKESITFDEGLERTKQWIAGQLRNKNG